MLLQPIKDKYGSALSWGDMIVLSGNAAIKSTGGTVLGFCGGRIDDADGSNSLILGPSEMQEQHSPCQSIGMQGDCLSVDNTALGPTTVELIYVNPEGPVTDPNNPVAAAADIRRAFARMGFDDQVSTILIGAGHAIGKAHGDPNGTLTSGLEGPWTTTPTTWSNEYFRNLFDYNYTLVESPAGHMQWSPDNGLPINMLTTDLALARDDGYLPYAQMYADNFTLHNEDFASAWYRLTSADMGPAVRCIGDLVPEPQEFQFNLPPSPAPGDLPDYVPIATAIEAYFGDDADLIAAFIQLAYNCAATFRATDYRGGCNGARIRFPPESEWPSNTDVVVYIDQLEEIKTTEGFDVSMADMIVLASILALEKSNPDLDLPFCGGYVDAEDGSGSEPLAPRFYSPANITVTDDFQVKGLTPEQGVALFSRTSVGSQYYIDLLAAGSDSADYTDEELALVTDEDLKPIVETYAGDEAALLEAFASGWTYLMTADRFKNNRENACTGVSTAFRAGETPSPVAAPTPDSTTTAPPSGASTAGVITGFVAIAVSLLSFY